MVKNTLVFNGTVRLLCKKINDILVCFFGEDVHSQMDSIYAKRITESMLRFSHVLVFSYNDSRQNSCKMQCVRHLNKYAVRYIQHVIEYMQILHHRKSYYSLNASYYSLINSSFHIFWVTVIRF